ncbi:MAG: hypothetical protein M1840_004076 [Geoglossum simile]|nr:MAG: hypothetical protein M1840_004076 [Geoglossum simile]
MAGTRPGLAWTSIILTASAIVFLFLVILGGSVNRDPLNQIYFLKADTSNVPGAPKTAQWTLWNVCDSAGTGKNHHCSGTMPAHPFDPPRNFKTTQNIDSGFIGTTRFYYQSRFMFAYYLISLIFALISLSVGLLALCSRLGAALSSILVLVPLFFTTLTAALMTSCFVVGRDNFNRNNQKAQIGVKAFGFTWGAFACLLVSSILFCLTCVAGRRERTYTSATTGRNGFWREGRSTRPKRSFMDPEIAR